MIWYRLGVQHCTSCQRNPCNSGSSLPAALTWDSEKYVWNNYSASRDRLLRLCVLCFPILLAPTLTQRTSQLSFYRFLISVFVLPGRIFCCRPRVNRVVTELYLSRRNHVSLTSFVRPRKSEAAFALVGFWRLGNRCAPTVVVYKSRTKNEMRNQEVSESVATSVCLYPNASTAPSLPEHVDTPIRHNSAEKAQALPSRLLSPSSPDQHYTTHCTSVLLHLPIIQLLTMMRSLPSHLGIICRLISSAQVKPLIPLPVQKSSNTELPTFSRFVIGWQQFVNCVYLLPARFSVVNSSENLLNPNAYIELCDPLKKK